MNEDYDIILLGTGLKETILSGLMAIEQKKILHIDQNAYYGGECASLNLDQIYAKFREGQQPPQSLGRSRDYCVDLCPKFLMAGGDLVRVLLKTKVTRYLQFKSVKGSYVYKEGKVHKVPATASEALDSSLMSFFEKRRFRNFLVFCSEFDESNPKTHGGYAYKTMTAAQLYDKFSLSDYTKIFIGHAVAMYENDQYLAGPCINLINQVKLYINSMQRYGNSPYIYPMYGLGGLPESFSRICSVYGGTYMLNTKISEIVYGEDGKVIGVKDAEGQMAKCNKIICDPSYVLGTNKVKKAGHIIRCICILSSPIPNTSDADSAQIVVPAYATQRINDIYVCVTSYHHCVAAKDKYLAVISTKLETKPEAAEREIASALQLLGKIDEKFTWVSEYYEPTDDGSKDNVYVTSSLDSTTHFESATLEVLDLYRRVTGTDIDLTNIQADEEDQ